MLKRPLLSLSDIPDTILSLCLIIGIGSVFGLLVFASFEIEKSRVLQARETVLPKDEYFGNRSILVKNPNKNSTISNPVFISGRANVYEATVRVRIKEGETVLADTFLTAMGFGNDLYDYKGNVTFSFPSGKNGSMEIFEDNPKNNKEANKITFPVVFEDHAGQIKWNTFQDNGNSYSFEYSSDLTIMTNSENDTVVYHKIPYKHDNLCTDKKNPNSTLSDINDFHVSINLINNNVSDSLRLKEGILNLNSEKLTRLEYIQKNAYSIDNTKDGCGTIDYFIELEKNKTIFIKRSSIPELKTNIETYAPLKGIILPTKNDHIFKHIILSLKNIN